MHEMSVSASLFTFTHFGVISVWGGVRIPGPPPPLATPLAMTYHRSCALAMT